MKKNNFAVMVSILVMLSCSAAYSEESGAMLTPGRLGIVAGGGQGGLNSDEVNEHQFIYGGVYGEVELTPGFNWRAVVQYFGNAEEKDEWYESSTSGLSNRVETYRFLTGPSFYLDWTTGDTDVSRLYWWMWNSLQVGADYEVGEGWLPVTVLSYENMFGVGPVYNFLTTSFRFGDEDYESYFLNDQFYVRITNWLAVGPQVKYVWFKQVDEDCVWGEKCDLRMVYEPAWGGQIKLTPNEQDPAWSVTVGGTSGDYVGTAWQVDFWMRLDSKDWAKLDVKNWRKK